MAGPPAADGVRSTILALQVAGADHAGVEIGELALAIESAPAPAARIQHRALVVALAPTGTARPIATLVAGQAIDDRLDAHPVEALIQQARIVVLAAAIAVVGARPHTIATGADLIFQTPARALRLGRHTIKPMQAQACRGCQCGSPEISPVAGERQQPRELVETS